ncbi:glycosyltransferase [Chlorogloeopsis sp. ULAP02]|uniref:glycosyltransferase n=1 Tax=Chlorogloeopsis sp. ULAP02 TaxID=3107926 RepID=UPI0031365532
MNLFVLSELYPGNKHVGWSVLYPLEEVLSSTFNATFIYPLPNNKIQLLRRYRHRIFKSWYKIDDLPTLDQGPNILLVIGLGPRFLLSIHALNSVLKKFDLRIGYILDGFYSSHLDRDVMPYLDYLFVICADLADAINRSTKLSTAFLPLATDVLKLGSNSIHRSIDIISYGRTDPKIHKCLQRNFNEEHNNRIYLHSTFSHPEVFNIQEHTKLLFKILSRSKISLCFEASNVERFQGYSPILMRWFESWSSGCTVVGKKPFGKGVANLINWQNSTIEVPDNPADWLAFFEELLSDNDGLIANSQRNYRECLNRHDWRYRIKDMFKVLELPIKENLKNEIAFLRQKSIVNNMNFIKK